MQAEMEENPTIPHHSHAALPNTFDADLARLLIKFASATYGNEKGWRDEIAQSYKLQEFGHFEIGSDAIVASNHLHIIIAFRGTASITDMLSDLVMVPYNGVHAGFLYWVETLRPELFDALRKLQDQKERRVLITGHSLGGAMAQVFARMYAEGSGKTPDAVYTFGAPSCFSPGVADLYNKTFKNTWRCYAQEDPIVFILNMFYSHTQSCAEVQSNGNVLQEPTSAIRINVFKHSLAVLVAYLKHTRSTARLGLQRDRIGFVDWKQFLDSEKLLEAFYLDPNTPELNLGQSKDKFIDDANVFIKSIQIY
jgi:predicted lipase